MSIFFSTNIKIIIFGFYSDNTTLTSNKMQNQAQQPMIFGIDPPSKIITVMDVIAIIMFYIGLDVVISMLLLIKHVKENWSAYKCKTNYMFFAWLFGFDAKATETNFQQCMQTMQSGYMTVLMQPANYLMSITTGSINRFLSIHKKGSK